MLSLRSLRCVNRLHSLLRSVGGIRSLSDKNTFDSLDPEMKAVLEADKSVPQISEEPFVYIDSPLLLDVQLPKKAGLVKRLGAGLIDAALGVGLGYGSGLLAAYLTNIGDVGDVVLSSVALTYWVFRDCLADEGTRSFGKKFMKIEITNWDGSLPKPYSTVGRSWYFLAIPFTYLHPLVLLGVELAVFFDSISFLISNGRKVGDYMLGTYVVEERANREIRVIDMYQRQEVEFLLDELRNINPDLVKKNQGWMDPLK